MKRTLAAITLVASTITAQAEPLTDLFGGQIGRIEYTSVTPQHRWAFVRKNTEAIKSVSVYGDLLMPKNMTPGTKVPAVVISHASNGVGATLYDLWAKELNAAGYAVFIPDSFKPRGLDRTVEDQSKLDPSANAADALYALKLLATHPQIDRKHIAIIGFSRGGTVAWDTRWDMVRRAVITDDLRFYAHVPIYPGNCGVRYRFDRGDTGTAPVLVMIAKKDDFDHAAGCVPMIEEINKTATTPIQFKWYDGYHAFDVPAKYYVSRNTYSAKECDLDINMNAVPGGGFVRSWDAKAKRDITSWEDFGATFKACQSQVNFATEGSQAATQQAVRDAIEFLNKNQ